MKLIHYGLDGDILVNNNRYSFEDFRKAEPAYSAPNGFHTRVYERGIRHYITDGNNLLHLPVTDTYCDSICNREGDLARLVQRLKRESED